MDVWFRGEEGWIDEEAEEDGDEDGGVEVPFKETVGKMIMDVLPDVRHPKSIIYDTCFPSNGVQYWGMFPPAFIGFTVRHLAVQQSRRRCRFNLLPNLFRPIIYIGFNIILSGRQQQFKEFGLE